MKCPKCCNEVNLIADAIFQRHRGKDTYVCAMSGKQPPAKPAEPASEPMPVAVPTNKP